MVVEREVDDLKLEVEVPVRLVWACLNERLYFLWRLTQMYLEGKMPSGGRRPFGMVM